MPCVRLQACSNMVRADAPASGVPVWALPTGPAPGGRRVQLRLGVCVLGGAGRAGGRRRGPTRRGPDLHRVHAPTPAHSARWRRSFVGWLRAWGQVPIR